MITKLDHHLAIPIDHTTRVLETLDLLAEILGYTHHDPHHAPRTDDWPPDTLNEITRAIDNHANILRQATNPHTRTATT